MSNHLSSRHDLENERVTGRAQRSTQTVMRSEYYIPGTYYLPEDRELFDSGKVAGMDGLTQTGLF